MTSLGNYDILEIISQTGPSTVYLARHKKLNRKTLLKVYRGGDPDLIDRFEREARIVADLNSDFIVQIYDFGEINGQYYISMEYVEGQNLHDFLTSHSLSADEIIEFSFQIARAVAVLHVKGYIHRDLKPENILVSNDQKIKLTDFGISLHSSLKRITSEGALLGTPMYMSPEQINNLPLTCSCDVFALGIIFYQMATGNHPFESEQYGEVFARILSHDPAPLSELRPDLPEWYCKMVARALSKEPQDRIQDAIALLKIMQENMPERFADFAIPGKSKRRYLRPVLFTTLLLLSAIIGVWYFQGYFSPPDRQPVLTDTLSTVLRNSDSSGHAMKPESTIAVQKPSENNNNKSNRSEANQENVTEHKDLVLPNKQPTTLFIQTYPWCKIYLNYKPIDQTPMTSPIKVTPGRYILGLQNPAYPSLMDTIDILPFQENKFYYHLDSIFARVDLKVIPWGKVYIDSKYIGTTPLKNPIYVTRDFHVLEIHNEYYKNWIDTLDTRNTLVIKRHIQLEEKL